MSDSQNRLYPDWIPEAENEPTQERFEKAYKPEFGWYIASKHHFFPGDVIAQI